VEYGVPVPGTSGPANYLSPFLFIGLISIPLEVLVIWNLCRIISDLAEARARPETAESAVTRRNLYVGMIVLQWLVLPVMFFIPQIVGITVILVMLFSLIIIGLMMDLMKQAQALCKDRENATNSQPEAMNPDDKT
jgi:hypothetical protein